MVDNGYNTSDFKRNINEDDKDEIEDGDDGPKLNEKAGEYMRELLSEKIKLNTTKFPISVRLIDDEVTKVHATGRIPRADTKYVDVYHEKLIKVVVKVLVPIKEHPKFNFVGKLLGPKGNTMKQLQEETMCKMSVLGRGSMRDRQKEEELRNSLDPKFAHLSDELHVEVSALATPAEAHARIAYALTEVKKYLTPDNNDMIRQTQMRDIIERSPRPGPPPGPPRPQRLPPAPPQMARPMTTKTKALSILDRARTAMESSYNYNDPYAIQEQAPRGPPPPRAPDSDYYYERFYEDESYYKDGGREYKPAAPARDVGTRRPARSYVRTAPYARPK